MRRTLMRPVRAQTRPMPATLSSFWTTFSSIFITCPRPFEIIASGDGLASSPGDYPHGEENAEAAVIADRIGYTVCGLVWPGANTPPAA